MSERVDGCSHAVAGHPILYRIAFFVALFVTLGKVSIIDVDSNLNTAFRARVVLDMAWVMATVIWKLNEVRSIQRGELVSVPASGAATFAS